LLTGCFLKTHQAIVISNATAALARAGLKYPTILTNINPPGIPASFQTTVLPAECTVHFPPSVVAQQEVIMEQYHDYYQRRYRAA